MKALNEVAILILVVSIVLGVIGNTITNGELIFKVILLFLNAVCCATWEGE